MSATAGAKRQDLPPPGGYRPINFKRVPMKTVFNGVGIIGTYLAVTGVSAFLYYLNCKINNHEDLEMRSSRHAIFPMLLAERDRAYLKQLRRNREEEASLMANVEGWEVGTYYGEPIYRTLPKDTLIDVTLPEYYVHASTKDIYDHINFSDWT